MSTRIISIFTAFLIFSCQQEDASHCTSNEPERNNDAVTISQGVWGDIWFWQGDFMPVCASGKISAVERTVYIYELTTNDDAEQINGSVGFFTSVNTPLIEITTSNAKGFFEVELEPGTYSIFVQEGENLYANSWSTQGINTITVVENQVSELLFDITY